MLPHWIRNDGGTYLTDAVECWVKVPYINIGTTDIYIYWNNSSAPHSSDGNKTFEFFDHFNIYSGWTRGGNMYQGPGGVGWSDSYLISNNTELEFKFLITAGGGIGNRIYKSLPVGSYKQRSRWYWKTHLWDINYITFNMEGNTTHPSGYTSSYAVTEIDATNQAYIDAIIWASYGTVAVMFDWIIIRKYNASEPTFTFSPSETNIDSHVSLRKKPRRRFI